VDDAHWIRDQPLDLDALIAETSDPSCGALAVFGGVVRDHNDGRAVEGMTYEAHREMAAKTLRELEAEVCARFGAARCRIVHRIGTLEVGQTSVYVVVRSAHRREAFRAAEYAIDTLKERLAVWKQEHYLGAESRFLEGTPLDPQDEA